jgi:predicted 3-demethylubiquinone-9 3-methyltransferase (glyoxalase superfamily)
MQKTTTFLMFVGNQSGKAEEAINFYTSLFKNSSVRTIERFGPGERQPEGSVKHADFTLDGQEYMAMDGGMPHAFTFTPAMSIFVICESEQEIDRLYGQLSQGGSVMMELSEYPFAAKFAWVGDRYGVSWQLNLPHK